MTKSRFVFHTTPLPGLIVVKRNPIQDDRGFFCRFYCSEEFREAGLSKSIVQINHAFTREKGAARGLHFQYPPHAETKIVSCLRGEIFDVAVDLRKGSPTFLRWHAEKLSADNGKSLLIPEGFGHAFQTMTRDCEVMYLHTAPFSPSAEGALNVADPRIGIAWPMVISGLSERDRSHAFVGDDFEGITL